MTTLTLSIVTDAKTLNRETECHHPVVLSPKPDRISDNVFSHAEALRLAEFHRNSADYVEVLALCGKH